jgi:DNA-binding NtrC family response regulator
MPKALVVDDEPDMCWLLSRVLGDQGVEVVTAGDGRAALELITREAPDVVLLDLKMPGLGGIEVLERAKAVDPRMPVVMVTAYGDLPSAVQAMRLGADDYLTKPFDNDEIIFSIRKALERKQLEAARLMAARVETLVETARALSDEINNPLAAILLHAQMLERELSEAKVTKKLEVIIERCQRIAWVIRRLSSIVEPTSTFHPGVGPMLDLAGSGTAREQPSENGEDPGSR